MRVGPHPHAELTLSRLGKDAAGRRRSYARGAPPPRGADAAPLWDGPAGPHARLWARGPAPPPLAGHSRRATARLAVALAKAAPPALLLSASALRNGSRLSRGTDAEPLGKGGLAGVAHRCSGFESAGKNR